jgi:ComF family protein
MFLISSLYKTLTDALFPISEVEQGLFLLQPEQAYEELPSAPGYEGLAVPMKDVQSIFAYKDERVMKLIWNIKYKKSTRAVKIGGYALHKKLIEIASVAPTRETTSIIIIPIPITNRRRKERGYNQCDLLVDEIEWLSRGSTSLTSSRFIIEKNLLVRTHHVSRQTLKGRKDRVESSQGIFEVNKEVNEIKKTPIIIIDDVITTGSTMFEAIETLKKAGPEDVRGLSLAH